MKTMKLSDFFELRKQEYVYIKITSHKSIRNFNSSNLAKAIALTYKTMNKQLKIENKKLVFETSFSIKYIIDIKHGECNFYFMIPKFFQNILLEKINEIWSKATLTILDNIEPFSVNSDYYELGYKKLDALSLTVDRKSNEPLNSILSVMDIVKDDDRLTIVTNFKSCSQFGWIERYNEAMDKFKNKKSLDKATLSPAYVFKIILSVVLETLDTVMEVVNSILGGKNEDNKESLYQQVLGVLEQQSQLSLETKKKKEATILPTQIAIVSSSIDSTRRNNNLLSTCQSYRVLDGDNELKYKKVKPFNLNQSDIGTSINILSTDEASSFIKIPGRSLLQQFKIKYIETEETEVPPELREGVFCLGTNICKGIKQKAHLSEDKDLKNLTLCIIGPTRVGKTNLLAHLCKNAIDNNETVIIPDFCGNCDLSRSIAKNIPKDKVLIIDCSDPEKLQGFGYNDIKANTDSIFDNYKVAKVKSQQLKTLINSINSENHLEPRMERYLYASSLVVFISNGAVKEIFEVLQDHRKRHEFISKIPLEQKNNFSKYVLDLLELDEWSKGSKDNPPQVIGTKFTSIQGILNRVSKLEENTYVEMMLNKDCRNNIDLLSEIEKGELICLQMPETMFSTEEEKDIYCSYWLTKIWGVLQIRYDNIPNELSRTKVNLIFDELYQVPKTQEFLRGKLNQIAKKTCKPIISCHSLEQIKYIKNELKSANASYMMISGCDETNYNELKDRFGPYELEDLLSLKRFHSLNMIKYENGTSVFITELPPKFK